MTQEERRLFLIDELLRETGRVSYAEPERLPEQEQKNLLRSLMNIRMPAPADKKFLDVQDEYLKKAISEKGITRFSDLKPVEDGIYLWQGDITTLEYDAIVNAANSQMLGCFQPLHNCIDNCIHTYAGIQLRNECAEIMKSQGHEEPTGLAKITKAYNLPSKFVIHTVGPIVSGRLSEKHCALLESSYISCLKAAKENGCASIAFCCISTGVFGFPQKEAAQIAIRTVKEHRDNIEVVFNVYKSEDYEIYKKLLCPDR